MTRQARETRGRGSGRMGARTAAWLAWSVWALCVALAVLSVLLDLYIPSARQPPNFTVLAGVPLLMYPTIGAFVVSRRPKNAVGWILCGMGFIFEVRAFTVACADYTKVVHRDFLPSREIMLGVTEWVLLPGAILGVVLLVLLFPDGKLQYREWRALVWMAVGGVVALLSFQGAKGAFSSALEVLVWLGAMALIVSCVGSVITVFVRLQTAEGRKRQQLKWFAYGAAVLLGTFISSPAAFQIGGQWAVFALIVTGLLGIPVAVGIAILKYRLYDIDRIINRTLVYASLTGILALVYVGGVTATQAVLQAFTGQEELPQLAIVASTLAIAALFNPLRRRIQSFIDRRFYRRKYDAAKTLAAFNARLREETDLDVLSDDLVGAVRGTVQPEHASLWLRPESAPTGQQTD
jgi:hypothetical protein